MEKIELININGLKQDIAKIDDKNAMIRDNKKYKEHKFNKNTASIFVA